MYYIIALSMCDVCKEFIRLFELHDIKYNVIFLEDIITLKNITKIKKVPIIFNDYQTILNNEDLLNELRVSLRTQ